MPHDLTIHDTKFLLGEKVVYGDIQLATMPPVAYLDWFEPFQDFLVASSDGVELDCSYASWFLRQSVGNDRFVLLDTIGQQYGTMFSSSSDKKFLHLIEASAASMVVAPYILNSVELTISFASQFKHYIKPFDVCGVIIGDTVEQKVECFKGFVEKEIDCIAFLCTHDRLKTIKYLADYHLLERFSNYILHECFSFKELEELCNIGEYTWLLISSAPIDAAVNNQNLTIDNISEIGYPSLPINSTLTPEQLHLATLNTAKLKALLPTQEDNDLDEEEE